MIVPCIVVFHVVAVLIDTLVVFVRNIDLPSILAAVCVVVVDVVVVVVVVSIATLDVFVIFDGLADANLRISALDGVSYVP